MSTPYTNEWVREVECSVDEIVAALKVGTMPDTALADVAARYAGPAASEWAAILDAARARYAAQHTSRPKKGVQHAIHGKV